MPSKKISLLGTVSLLHQSNRANAKLSIAFTSLRKLLCSFVQNMVQGKAGGTQTRFGGGGTVGYGSWRKFRGVPPS